MKSGWHTAYRKHWENDATAEMGTPRIVSSLTLPSRTNVAGFVRNRPDASRTYVAGFVRNQPDTYLSVIVG